MKTSMRMMAIPVAAIFLAAGCAQVQNIPLTRTEEGVVRPAVQAGDHVIVTTSDGARHKFQVTSADSEALQGAHDRIAYAEMARLDVEKKSEMHVSKTALVVGAVVLGAVAVGAASGGGSSGGY